MQLPATRQKIESNDSHVTRTLDDALVNVDVNVCVCMRLLLMQLQHWQQLLLMCFYLSPQQFPIKAAAAAASFASSAAAAAAVAVA